MALSKKKIAAAATAVVLSASLLMGGTFAWQSISQTALNEASDVINPGGRLHDDFNGENKDIYVENFADDPIFARIQLSEYMEIITNYDTKAEQSHYVAGSKDTESDPVAYNYDIHYFDQTNATDEYWNWATGGSTVYMPTFNKNKDSIEADLNGRYVNAVGGISNRDLEVQYEDYVEYEYGTELISNAVYDADANSADDDGVTYVEETHYADNTLGATLMSMQEWIDAGSNPGDYWVYDTDGWVYWANAIQPGTATGLLLDGIELNQVMDDTWYYAIHVNAQFVTADDVGKTDGTGFYTDGAPTAEAQALLAEIGVDMEGPVMVSDAAALQDALNAGENVTIDGEIDSIESQSASNVTADFLVTEGGTLENGTINANTGSYAGLFVNAENNWPTEGAAVDTTIDSTTINSNADFALYIQAVDANVTVKDTTVNGTNGGILAEHSSGGNVTLNNVTSTAGSQSGTWWINTAVAAANGANVEINGGSYTGDYAALVFSSGGTININSGDFNGKLGVDGGTGNIIISGGTFTVDPSAYVADGYEAVDNGNGTWTVQ